MSRVSSSLRDTQIAREHAARQAALGRRAEAIAEGKLGPVLRRWINADVVPIAELLRDVARCYTAGDMQRVASLLDAPTAELSQREQPLKPLMEWVLRGRSPGRADIAETSHAEDLVLSFMAVLLMRLARDEKLTIAAGLALAADALRDTVQGQFISGVQGASAMQRVRELRPEAWKQRKSLNRICARLYGQVKPYLDSEDRGEGAPIKMRGSKKVVEVIDHTGELRRLELRKPDPIDWEVMSLCWRDERSSETSPHRSLWLAFSSLVLASAQRVGGWFEFASSRTGRRGHTRTTKYLVLSNKAKQHIAKDVERWTSLGFTAQPMLVPPEGNDYLTVKHRPVTGQRPPRGLLTTVGGTSAWECGAAAIAESPWNVNTHTLSVLATHTDLWNPEDPSQAIRVAEHRRLANDTFYLPTTMDFRGRIYYRTPWVSPQSGDLGKALLCFPPNESFEGLGDEGYAALEMHLSGLYGLDKRPYPVRAAWVRDFFAGGPKAPYDWSKADKPLTLAAAAHLLWRGEEDRIPVQLDGTCNGLQHLTALTRDHDAAPHVNLTPSTLDEAPADIYGAVALQVDNGIARLLEDADDSSHPGWAHRLSVAGLNVTRSLTKGPVMVLPYGGTREAVRLSVKAAVLDQLALSAEQLHSMQDSTLGTPWADVPGYEAFRERALHDNPLFNQDVARLGTLVWDCITPAIPRAMAFMLALQEIGSWVGERALAWQVGGSGGSEDAGFTETPSHPSLSKASPSLTTPSTTSTWASPASRPLWVIQAKSKASRKQVTMRGFHLPDLVRRLTLMSNLNEIDPRAHRTGIVANFVHSLDAAHLAASVSAFKERGGSCVGSVHDCLLVRPSEAALMGSCLREQFVRLHEDNDPLLNPVKVGTIGPSDEVLWKDYADWYELAAEAGVAFPERGEYRVEDVLRSAWFFS